jgi:hypothetical protein
MPREDVVTLCMDGKSFLFFAADLSLLPSLQNLALDDIRT